MLSGTGTAISSTAQTVTDVAGNVSAPSNVVTVKIVNPSGLCALTVDDVTDSSKYRGLTLARRHVADVLTERAGSILASSEPPPKHVLVARYEQVVDVLATQGWLTSAQAHTLSTLATGL